MIAQMANQFSTLIANIVDWISYLEEGLRLIPAVSLAPEQQVPLTDTRRRVKPRLPDPERYDGGDLYEA